MAAPQTVYGQNPVSEQPQQAQAPQQPYQQPQQTQQVTYQPYQRQDLARVSDWSVGLFDCFDDFGLCLDASCCNICQQSRLHDSVLNGRQDSFNGAVCCGLLCCPWAHMFHLWYLRNAVRGHLGLKGNAVGDCCVSMFCRPCATCQAHKQVKAYGMNPGVTCCSSTTPVLQAPGPGGFVPQGPM